MVLHPDWNIANGHHTDVEFKPAIARYDWDQTYDVLEFVYLPSGFDQLIYCIGIPSYHLVAIDRYTPYDYLWAEEYSDYVFNFLKEFNFSPDTSLDDRDVRNYKNISIATIPRSSLLNLNFWNEYLNINAFFEKGEYRITGLIDHGIQGTLEGITTINQCFYQFNLIENKQLDIRKILNRWLWNDVYVENNKFCACSLVISKKDSNGVYKEYIPTFSSKPSWLLYSDINVYFSNYQNQLINYFDSNFNNYKVDNQGYSTLLKPRQGYIDEYRINYTITFNTSYYPDSQDIIPLYRGFYKEMERTLTIQQVNFTTKKFPQYLLDFCYLQRANNNKWKSGKTFSDLGMTPLANKRQERNLDIDPFDYFTLEKNSLYPDNFRDSESVASSAIILNNTQLQTVFDSISRDTVNYPDDKYPNNNGEYVIPQFNQDDGRQHTIPFKNKDLDPYDLVTDRNLYFPPALPEIIKLGSALPSTTRDYVFCNQEGFGHFQLNFYIRKITRNRYLLFWSGQFFQAWKAEYTLDYLFTAYDDSEFEYDYGYHFTNPTTRILSPPSEILRDQRIKYVVTGVFADEGITRVLKSKHPVNLTKSRQIYEINEVLTASEWEEVYKGTTHVSDSEYLTYLLQLKEEWETQDRLNYEEEKNA